MADVDPTGAVWVAVAAQLPLVTGFFAALQRGWVYVGRTVDAMRADWQAALAAKDAELALERQRTADAVAERKEAQERLDSFREAMRQATDVTERAVSFNERLFAELQRRGD